VIETELAPGPAPAAAPEELPFCTIVVPTPRRPQQLAQCLDALARLEYPRERFEVIVVDDGGGVPLDDVLEGARRQLDLSLITQRCAGPGAARNRGVAAARGELLVFTDDDCRPRPDWLRILVDHYLAEPERGFGGHTDNALRQNKYASVSQMLIDAGYVQNNSDPETARFFTTNNLALPIEGFRAIGGFDESFITSEDRELCDRWIASGRTLSYVPEALVDHAHHLSFATFCRQQFAYGRGAFRFHEAYARRQDERVKVEMSFFRTLGRRLLREEGRGRILVLFAVLQVWNLSNTAGFVWQWMQSRKAASQGTEHVVG